MFKYFFREYLKTFLAMLGMLKVKNVFISNFKILGLRMTELWPFEFLPVPTGSPPPP